MKRPSLTLSYDVVNTLGLYPFRDEREAAKFVSTLSKNFTVSRDRISDYRKSSKLISAYNLFFMTTNLVKFHHGMNLLPRQVVSRFKDYDFIDVGTGPGTFILGFLDYFMKDGITGYIHGIEISDMMAEQGQKNVRHYFTNQRGVHFHNNYTRVRMDEERPRVMFFGNSYNEIGKEKSIEMLDHFDPSYVIFMEPGTKSVFAQLLEMRDVLQGKGYHTLYPCASNAACPLMGTDDWCHQYFKVAHHPSIERMSQILRMDRRNLPVTFHVYTKNPDDRMLFGDSSMERARVVQKLGDTKFSFEYTGCSLQGEEHRIDRLQLLKKDYNKDELKHLSKTLAGELLEFEVTKDVGPGHRRISIPVNLDESKDE